MFHFLQLAKPDVDVPADSVVIDKLNSRFHELLQMSWSDLSHTLVSDLLKFSGKLAIAIIIYFVGRWLIRWMDRLLNRIFERRKVDTSLNKFIRNMLRIVAWIFLLLIIVGILGIKTTSFLAILASAGFAVGMALSGTLQNFAGGVLILLLKPFRTGDYIVSQGQEGTVKEINLFNTVLATPDNKTIIIPNGGMSSSIVNNVTDAGTRRIEWTFGIAYGDDYDEARRVLQQLIAADERIFKTPEPLIALSNLADSAVQIVVRVWAKTDDYWAIYYGMNEKVYKVFPEHGLSIPFNQLDVNITTLSAPGAEDKKAE